MKTLHTFAQVLSNEEECVALRVCEFMVSLPFGD